MSNSEDPEPRAMFSQCILVSFFSFFLLAACNNNPEKKTWRSHANTAGKSGT